VCCTSIGRTLHPSLIQWSPTKRAHAYDPVQQ